MNKKIIAQMPPMPPMGGDPMGGPPGMPPGAPGAPGAERPEISGPLKSVGEVLYDFNAEEYIALHPTEDDEEIAAHIWEEYGGNIDGSVDETKIGERKDDDGEKLPEEVQKEKEATENSKWKRLPAGKNISDITSLDEITGLMSSLTYGTIKKFRTPPAPPGGGMPPMAASNNSMERLAAELKNDLDKLRKYM